MSSRYFLPVLTLLVLAAASVPAQSGNPDMVPSKYILSLARESGELSPERFLEAALFVSGSDADDIPALVAASVKDAFRAAAVAEAADSVYDRGEYLLSDLHRFRLVRYSERETRFDVLVGTGTYNCVSSAIAYVAYAKAAGIPVSAVMTKDHAFCVMETERGRVDVETTNPYGFDPGTKKEFRDSFGKTTGYAYTPPKAYSGRTPIGEKNLLGLVLSNRIADLERLGGWDDAVSLAVDRHALESSPETRDFLFARLYNYVAILSGSRRWTEALDFIDSAMARFGPDDKLESAVSVVIGNSLSEFASRSAWDAGAEFGDSMRKRYGDIEPIREFSAVANHNRVLERIHAADFRGARALVSLGTSDRERADLAAMVNQGELSWASNDAPYETGMETLEYLLSSGGIGIPAARDGFLGICGKEASRVARTSGWLAAARVYDRAIAVLAGNAELVKARKLCLGNYAISVHNEYVTLIRAGKPDEALAVLSRGLLQVPDNSTLLDDMRNHESSQGGSKRH